jgi:hypothetical protein
MEIKINETDVIKGAQEGMDEFLKVFSAAIYDAIGGDLNADTMAKLNNSQIVLLGYLLMRDELMDGGFVQLIHNGYGGFILHNPMAKVLKEWGLNGLSKLLYSARHLYDKYHEDIEKECSDDEFMAMFERYQDFDDLDDEFVENEEGYTDALARYVDEHIDSFATIVK